VGKDRDVETLSEYDESKHLEVVKNGEIELYENEYHLIEKSLGLPLKFMGLGALEQTMVLLFVDKDFIEPNSEKKTENDAFISFLAAYDKKKVVEKIYKTASKITGYDRDGSALYEHYKIVDAEQMALYMKLKAHATMVWKNSNLKEISKSMREIVTNNGFKDEELLRQKILSDALSPEKSTFTMQNRRLSVDINGMKQPMGLQVVNVFLKGGGKESSEIVAEITGNAVYELAPPGTKYE